MAKSKPERAASGSGEQKHAEEQMVLKPDEGEEVPVKKEELLHLAAIVQSSDDAIIGKTLDGIITSWNKGAEKLYGYREDEVLGKSINILVPPNHYDELPSFIEEMKKGKSIHHYETERRKKDGNIIDVSLALSAIRDAEGNIVGVSTIAREITALKQASSYARSLIEASLDPLVTISPDGKINDVNEATIKITGVPREKLIGTDFLNYFTEPDKAREGYLQVFSQGYVTDYPLTIRHTSGKETDVLYNASVYTDIRGKVLGVFAAARDITEQKQAQEAAQAERKRLFDVLETLPAMICLLTQDHHVAFANRSFRQRFGESQGRPCYEYCFGFDEPCEFCESYGVLESGMPHHWEVNAPDGSVIDAYDFPFTDVDGTPMVLEMDLDITDAKQAKAELQKASAYNRSLVEVSLDPLVTISPDGKITDVNEATIKVTGVPRGELIGTDFSNYFSEPEKAREGYRQVFSQGFVTDYPLTIRHKSGKLTDVLYNASVYRDAEGKVLGVFAAARDVTTQNQAASYARSLIEASLDPLVTISPEGKITDVNEATIKVTGVSRKELIGTDFSNYFTEPEKASEGYQQVFSTGSVIDYPLTIRHKSGNLADVLYNASVYRDVRGNVLGVFAAARDVTAQKRQAESQVAEQRAKELERLADLERFQKLTVGRELKMIELKKEIEALTAENTDLHVRLGESGTDEFSAD